MLQTLQNKKQTMLKKTKYFFKLKIKLNFRKISKIYCGYTGNSKTDKDILQIN